MILMTSQVNHSFHRDHEYSTMFCRLEGLNLVCLFAKHIAKIKVDLLPPLDLRQPLMVPLSHVSLLLKRMSSTEALRNVYS
jgi:hypothetical protein